MSATTPPSTTSPATAGEVAASLARRMSSPVRAGVPAVLVGILTAALAWPGIPAAAWVTAITVLVLLVIHALTLDRNRPERGAPDPDPAWSWSGRSDGPITIALLFGGRVVRSILVGTFDVPVSAAVGFVGVAAAAIVWWALRRPGSDMAPPRHGAAHRVLGNSRNGGNCGKGRTGGDVSVVKQARKRAATATKNAKAGPRKTGAGFRLRGKARADYAGPTPTRWFPAAWT